MNHPFISVIVPVYNVENYLKGCLESLLNQSVQNFEVILVDDGSTDSSGKIADSYAKKYSHFIKRIKGFLALAIQGLKKQKALILPF